MTRWAPGVRSAALCWVLLVGGTTPAVDAAVDPERLATELASFGARHPGSPGYRRAQRMLLGRMVELGLRKPLPIIDSAAGRWTHLTATHPGESGAWIELTAHYDTTEATVGRIDNASGCAVALAAAEAVGSAARRLGLRVVLTDAEEQGARGSREWLAGRPADRLGTVLANLNLDGLGTRRLEPGVLHLAGTDAGGHLRLTPAWLVNAALQAAAVARFPMVVMDRRWSLLWQLGVRMGRPSRISDSGSYLAVGVPSLTFSDLDSTAVDIDARDEPEPLDRRRLERWVEVVKATIDRLEGYESRPVGDTEFLVLGGSVIARRDLIWPGFLLWVLLVWRGLPGRWRRESADGRRRRGRSYLPGFAFRMVFLVGLFMTPTLASLLLYPTAVFALVGSRSNRRRRQVLCILGLTPMAIFAVWLIVAQIAGWLVLTSAAVIPAVLLLLTVATYCTWMLDPGRHGGRPSQPRSTVNS